MVIPSKQNKKKRKRRLKKKKVNELSPLLKLYGKDLTSIVKNRGEIDGSHFYREKELSEIMEILARRIKNCPILLGPPGIGKAPIIYLFAQKIRTNLVPFFFSK